MAIALDNLPVADASFTPAGAAAWDGSPVWSGLTAGQILFPSSSSALTDSASLTWGTAAGQGLFLGAGTATTDVNALSITHRWNNGAIPFRTIKVVITEDASAAGALPLEILAGAAGSTLLMSLTKGGLLNIGSIQATGNVVAVGDVRSGINMWLTTNGGGLYFGSGADSSLSRISAGLLGISTGTPGFAGSLKLTDLFTNNAAALIKTNTTLTDGAGASVGTLTNAPAAGNPTKWVGINDNGTTRYIPAW